MYAVAFDLSTDSLKTNYHNDSWQNAYGDIKQFLESHDFMWQQKSVYFGKPSVDAVTCVLTIIQLSQNFPWFAPSVTDIRMLRIEENNNLIAAVEKGAEIHA